MRPIKAFICLALFLATTGCHPASPPDTYTLSYASPYPQSHPLSRGDQAWISYLEKASGGRLHIRASWSGALISSELNITELRHGVSDIATISPIYARGGTQAIKAQAGFYGGERSIADQVAVYKCLEARYPALNRNLEGLHILAIQGGNALSVITRKTPVHTLDDVKGLRLRAPAELIPLLRQLKADPVDMPMSDVYPAMAKGVIDGVIAPADTLKSLHFGDVGHYFNELRISRGGYPARAISLTSLHKLPPDLQALIILSQGVWEDSIATELQASEDEGRSYGKAQGMQFISFAPQDQQTFDAMYYSEAVAAARKADALGVNGSQMLSSAQNALARRRSGSSQCE